MLERAKRQSDREPAREFNVLSRKGAVSLNSLYRYRLFQLLPVLQRLDKSKAEQLLQENPSLKGPLEQYPDGMRSLDTALTSTPKPRGEYSDLTTISSGPVAPFDAAAIQRQDDTRKHEKEIYELARHDPKEALKLAEVLPKVQRNTLRLSASWVKSSASETRPLPKRQ